MGSSRYWPKGNWSIIGRPHIHDEKVKGVLQSQSVIVYYIIMPWIQTFNTDRDCVKCGHVSICLTFSKQALQS